jgi:hypothetical protein
VQHIARQVVAGRIGDPQRLPARQRQHFKLVAFRGLAGVDDLAVGQIQRADGILGPGGDAARLSGPRRRARRLPRSARDLRAAACPRTARVGRRTKLPDRPKRRSPAPGPAIPPPATSRTAAPRGKRSCPHAQASGSNRAAPCRHRRVRSASPEASASSAPNGRTPAPTHQKPPRSPGSVSRFHSFRPVYT